MLPAPTLFVFVCAVSVIKSHSWVERLMVFDSHGTMVGVPGYPRGAVSRLDPNFNDFQMQHLLPSGPTDDNALSDRICKATQTIGNYTNTLPPLYAWPGAFIALQYQENGHVSLPNLTPQKKSSGKVYIYGTTSPSHSDTLTSIHGVWNKEGTGGDRRGRLVASRNFDDEISQLYSLYWVWDWPSAASNGLPDGKLEIYTTCIDIEIGTVPEGGQGRMNFLDGQDLNTAGGYTALDPVARRTRLSTSNWTDGRREAEQWSGRRPENSIPRGDSLICAVEAGSAWAVETAITAFHDRAQAQGMRPYSFLALGLAAFRGNNHLVKIILERSIMKPDWTTINVARSAGRDEIARYLLDHSGLANAADSDGRTPLWTASDKGDYELAKFLLGVDYVDVTKADRHNHTPMFRAILNGHHQIVELFMRCGKVSTHDRIRWL
ncbi:hypothetical protein Purlil1_13502 [Purpureocillium lilacinum]|uniref:DUF7492 domain-containing protein n=1 Tax=Purpureocillium lilacinum TaxID=33203 RepID=A0ABR0BDW1_PURLI|nr:hypothetical protein Purlil1_13502 [Purpureocillium lilacinum]